MKTSDLVGMALGFGVLFASAWVISTGWKRGQRNDESEFNGESGGVIGLGAARGARASAMRGGLNQSCCSTICSQQWNNEAITNLEDLGNCVRIHCKLR